MGKTVGDRRIRRKAGGFNWGARPGSAPSTNSLTTGARCLDCASDGWGRSSVGRAPQWHCGGQGFESPRLHHLLFFVPSPGRARIRLAAQNRIQLPESLAWIWGSAARRNAGHGRWRSGVAKPRTVQCSGPLRGAALAPRDPGHRPGGSSPVGPGLRRAGGPKWPVEHACSHPSLVAVWALDSGRRMSRLGTAAGGALSRKAG